MNFKYALAAAALVAAAGSAQAADLAKKAPAAANYVKVCDAYGAGFFYIPGSDTCLKIGGYARFQATVYGPSRNWNTTHGGAYGWTRNQNGISTATRGNLNFDARSNTEMGLLRSYIEFSADNGSYAAGGSTNVYLNKAFIQFGGLTAGRSQSNFDFITSSGPFTLSSTNGPVPDVLVNLLAYTFSFGNGITATLSVEDPSTTANSNPAGSSQALRRVTYTGANGDTYGGVHTPDLVANINVTQAWGSAQLSGVLHDDAPGTAGVGGKLGWAILGGVKVNLPMLGEGDLFGIQGTYSKGAVYYASNGFQGGSVAVARDFYVNGTSVDQSTAYSIYAALTHNWTKKVYTTVGVGYTGFEAPAVAKNATTTDDFTYLDARATLGWKPVTNLLIAGEVGYGRVDYKNNVAGSRIDADRVQFDLRIQRTF